METDLKLMPRQYEVKCVDDRCRWWSKVVRKDVLLTIDPGEIDVAGTIPGNYLRKGADLSLEPGDLVIIAEENHHRKQRGWAIHGLLCIDTESEKYPGEYKLIDVEVGIDRKREIGKTRPDLLRGSGDLAAIIRSARFKVETI